METKIQRWNIEEIEALLESQMTEVVGGGNEDQKETDDGTTCVCGLCFAKS